MSSNYSDRFRNRLLYANLGKEEFEKNYSKINEGMIEENITNLGALTIIASVLFGAMMIASLFVSDLAGFRILYVVMFAVSVITFVLKDKKKKKTLNSTRVLCYSFVFLVFAFAIILGTVYSPDELSATYMVLIVAAPLVFVDKPMYFALLEEGTYLLFVVMEILYKSDRWLVIDITNGTVFTIFAVFTCIYVMNSKLQKLVLEMQLDERSTTDVLTGLKNRRSYEDDLEAYDAGLLDKTYMIYMDVNGLHELNDSKGHEAGDEMLRSIASAIKGIFHEHSYRIGGDEFVAFGADRTTQQVETSIESLKRQITESGYAMSVGCIMGSEAGDIKELVRLAEQEMYKAKTEYYRDKAHDRRHR